MSYITSGIGRFRVNVYETFTSRRNDFGFSIFIRSIIGVVYEETKAVTTERWSKIIIGKGIDEYRESSGITATGDTVRSFGYLVGYFSKRKKKTIKERLTIKILRVRGHYYRENYNIIEEYPNWLILKEKRCLGNRLQYVEKNVDVALLYVFNT